MLSRRRLLALGGAAPAAWSADSHNNVPLRTHEWFGDRVETFEFPSGWQIDVRNMKGWQTPVLPAVDIKRAVENPVGTKPLREIAAGKKTAAIAFDDMTRPTPTYDVVPYVLAELNAAGLRDDNIVFVAAYGCHYMMNGMEVEKKLGTEAVRRCPWINHNVWENLEDRGVSRAGNQIFVNTYYAKADVKITLSGLRAHGTPGYGGGPKLILPGVSGVKTIRYMHQTVKQSPRPRVDASGTPIFHVWDNEQRQDMIDAARRAGVDFSVQMVYNQDRRLVHVVSGDVVRAHHRAARYAVNHLATEYAKDADIVVVNAYPRGGQVHEQFGWGLRGLKPGGSIVMVNQNPMGESVWHFLDEERFNQGQAWTAQRDGRKRGFPQASQLLVYSQYLQKRELDGPYFPPEAQGLRSWTDVLTALRKQHRGDVKVAIYPYAGIQHGPAVLDIPDGEC
jgi:nickel-dependent lactate racemase